MLHALSAKARGGEARCLAGQESPVGGEGEVFDSVDRGDLRHQSLDVLPEERLTAGDPDLGHAPLCEEADEAGDLVEVE